MSNNTLYLKHIPAAQVMGAAVARSLFISMLNPQFRGKNFTWEKYKQMVMTRTEISLFMCFPVSVWKRHSKELIECAKHSAKLTAEECLKESGVEEWLPLTQCEDKDKNESRDL